MQQFIEKYKDQIVGILSGFDRLVFRGSLRRLNYGRWDRALGALVARGMEEYLWQNKILFKHYAQHVKLVSERLKQASLKRYRERNLPVIFLRSSQVDKDKLARRIAEEKKIRSGPVCALSSLEPSPTFEHRGKNIIRRQRPCGVMYHYQIHPEVGWMYARIQTWFPFNVQIGLNGREWLARQMAQEGLSYHQQGNCLVGIEDYPRAQALLDQQLKTDWVKLFDGLAEQLNPIHATLFEQYSASYYWTCHQSEWATDIVFRDADFLKRLMAILVPHGMLSFSSRDVLRYFSKRVKPQSGGVNRRHPATDHRQAPAGAGIAPLGRRQGSAGCGEPRRFPDQRIPESRPAAATLQCRGRIRCRSAPPLGRHQPQAPFTESPQNHPESSPWHASLPSHRTRTHYPGCRSDHSPNQRAPNQSTH